MDIRYSTDPNDVKRYTTEELRKEFLIENLYVADSVVAVYSHVDRMVTLGCMPVSEAVSIDKGIDVWSNFGTHYFLERREIGIFNIGGAGKITVDGTVYELGYKDCLYIAMDAKEVLFSSDDPEKPAKFYMVSAPAHRSYETRLLKLASAMQRAGVDYECHLFAGGAHGISMCNREVETPNPEAAAWVELCKIWLNKKFNYTP